MDYRSSKLIGSIDMIVQNDIAWMGIDWEWVEGVPSSDAVVGHFWQGPSWSEIVNAFP